MPLRQLTDGKYGHILTHANVWSPDGQWIAYDLRSDPFGSIFDGDRIEAVHVETGEILVLYQAVDGAHCGVVTWHPTELKVVFILGPEHPTAEYSYNPARRRGVIVDFDQPEIAKSLDARDLVPPFTLGALRGGSHVHLFSPDGQRVSFTYEDDVCRQAGRRDIAVCFPRPVRVPRIHPRNQDGDYFSVLATRTMNAPRPGSDEISRAFEEGWIGDRGYRRQDGAWQKYSLAFLGNVLTEDGSTITEVFIVDLPEDLAQVGDGPLQGTETQRPFPPWRTMQRRLTFTASRKYPGVSGPRHWLRSSSDGSRIAFLMKDERNVAQIWTISPDGHEPVQITRNNSPITSAFSWHPDGRHIVHGWDDRIGVTDVETGKTRALTAPVQLRPQACVYSPDGSKIAFVAPVKGYNQIFVVDGTL